MSNPIGHLGHVASSFAPAGSAPPAKSDDAGFQQLLKDALQSTASMQAHAQQTIQDRLAGEDITNVEVFSDVRKADLALRMMLQIRNKLLEAYNELKQMQF